MRLFLFIISFLLVIKQETYAQNNLCNCATGKNELKQLETLFGQKEYTNTQILIDKIPAGYWQCVINYNFFW